MSQKTKTKDMFTTEGLEIVGYRYGDAPADGRSWNYAENAFEPGVSMAQVGFDKEIGSFAVSDGCANRKKVYYIGVICGTGGDGEICLRDVRRISREDYLVLREKMVDVSNQIVNDRIDTQINLINRGYILGKTIEQLEDERRKYIR